MAKFCVNCGKKLEDDFACCPECGTFCNGAPQQKAQTTQQYTQNTQQNYNQASAAATTSNAPAANMLDKWVAILLLVFLGGFGAHKFYEGKMGLGILYLFTGALFGIGWIVDLITLLGKPDKYTV